MLAGLAASRTGTTIYRIKAMAVCPTFAERQKCPLDYNLGKDFLETHWEQVRGTNDGHRFKLYSIRRIGLDAGIIDIR